MTPPPARVLLYSHDSFGLGHLRRCRALGGALTAARGDLTTLIISGSPIIGAFEFPERVDFVRVPGVIKLRDGAYTPTKLTVETADAFRLRAEIIEETARVFRPDLVIVDKEPLGLRGELTQTLGMLKSQGARLVLDGQLTPGTLFTFMIYTIMIAGAVASPPLPLTPMYTPKAMVASLPNKG